MTERQVNLAELRRRAEVALAGTKGGTPEAPAPVDGTHLVEELRIYQTELEIQNQELRQSQASLSLALDKYRSLFDFLPLPAVLVDENGYLLESNRQAQSLLGLRTSLRQQRYAIALFLDGPGRFRVQAALKDPDARGPAVISPAGVRAADGETIPCEIHLLRLGEEAANARECLALFLDKRQEAMLVEKTRELETARAAAEAANRAKTSFLSVASHELRTPMNGVMGLLALLKRKTDDPLVLEHVDKADRASRQLLAVINDVLDITRIESNQLQLAHEAFALREIRVHLLDAVASLAQDGGPALHWPENAALERRHFRGDPGRLSQVLINLVGNALKFTPAGEVAVGMSAIGRASDESTHLRFEIRDTGIGIAPEDQGRIFQPFEQVDSTLTRRHRGTGLGLAVCKRLVEAMKGHIGVVSERGHGSLFWFEVPLEDVPESDAEAGVDGGLHPAGEIASRHRGARVLVVEDEPLNQEVARALLEDVGLAVTTAANGREALRYAEREHFHLILMDVNMPVMGGHEAARAIRRIPAQAATPIVALSANAFREDREASAAAGMNDHIGKPVVPELLYRVVLRWLEAERPAR